MADNIRSLQECKRVEGLVQELAEQMRLMAMSNVEQMRQMMTNHAAEMVDFKEIVLANVCHHTGGEETSHMSSESMS